MADTNPNAVPLADMVNALEAFERYFRGAKAAREIIARLLDAENEGKTLQAAFDATRASLAELQRLKDQAAADTEAERKLARELAASAREAAATVETQAKETLARARTDAQRIVADAQAEVAEFKAGNDHLSADRAELESDIADRRKELADIEQRLQAARDAAKKLIEG